jgi:hypothetical protein
MVHNDRQNIIQISKTRVTQGEEMNFLRSEYLITGVSFIFMFIFGFTLSKSGKPYNGFLFNFHKLIGLGAGIYLVRLVYLTNKANPFNTTQILAIGASVLFFLGLVVTGGLISADVAVPEFVNTIHKILPYLAVISTGVTLYLIL